MRYSIKWALFLLVAAVATQAGAATLQHQRAAFKAIASDIQNGNLEDIPQRIQTLKGYVLYPYLRYTYLRARLRTNDDVDAAVRGFIKRWNDLPLADRLRNLWLRQLAKRKAWKSFKAHYESTREPHLRCDAVVARLKLAQAHTGKPANDKGLVSDALNLWMTGRDQPKACNLAFQWLGDIGKLTPARYKARADLALDRGQTHLAEYLARRQKGAAQHRTRERIALQRRPLRALKKLLQQHDDGVDSETVEAGLLRLARNHPSPAAHLYKPLATAYKLTKAQRRSIERGIALGFAWDRQPQALDWLAKLNGGQVDETVRSWRIRAALYQQDWDAAMAWLRQLKPAEAAKSRWRYWRARVLAARGDTNQAHKIYHQLVQDNGYYAWLASSRLGRRFRPTSHAVALDRAAVKKLESKPGIIRARELFKVGWWEEGRGEWRRALSGAAPGTWRQAGLLAQQWGWHSQAIISLANAGVYKDLAVNYPKAHKKQVLAQSRKHGISPAWVYGVIRAESLFMADARSYAGARGLMQLLPATAREVAHQEGVSVADADRLYNPRLNVRLGSRYLKHLLSHFNGNIVLATAAYNAGSSRVGIWVSGRTLPADIWIENIPYNQTRHYVKRVLGYTIIFEWRLNHRIESAAKRMPPIRSADLTKMADRGN